MVRIKICGITNPADAELAASLGADMIGLNFYAKSPRCIDEGTARSILQVLPPSVWPVALFVDESPERAWRAADALGIANIQMHGEHQEVMPCGPRWITAFSVSEAADLLKIRSLWERHGYRAKEGSMPFAILVDAQVPGMRGGTGQTAPWHLLAGFNHGAAPLILAGGLTPDNVAEAIRIVKPWGVDVASGVESAPGKKDADKMRRFIDAVREVQSSRGA